MYQTMDPLFVGLIFSVYANDSNSAANTIQLTCFQAAVNRDKAESREVELVIVDSPLQDYNLEG